MSIQLLEEQHKYCPVERELFNEQQHVFTADRYVTGYWENNVNRLKIIHSVVIIIIGDNNKDSQTNNALLYNTNFLTRQDTMSKYTKNDYCSVSCLNLNEMSFLQFTNLS